MKINTNPKKIEEVLTRGVAKIYPNLKALKRRMTFGKKLKLYCGYDPSTPTLHIGHMVTLRKLAQFQKLGHEVIMLIGDFTGMIGDPTDKTAVRKKLTRKQVIDNSKNYKKQASRFLKFSGPNPAKILHNSQWSDKLSFVDLIELASNFTVQQMIIRDMFQERIKNKKPVFLHEFLYPLAQGYDSVAMDVDLEIGGKDQTFNMLCGRDLMKALKNKEKCVLTTKLLTGPSGKKMGKTEGNIINLNIKPEEMYGGIMAWPDGIIPLGFELCTDLATEEIKKISKAIKEKKINPRDAKLRLAKEIITICYSRNLAEKAEKEFNKIFQKKELPSRIQEIKISGKNLNILELLLKVKLVSSKSEARRLILQKGVRINSEVQKDWRKIVELEKGLIIQAGKRKFVKLG